MVANQDRIDLADHDTFAAGLGYQEPMAPDVLDLMDAMRHDDQAAKVLQPANVWERDRIASKVVELVQAGEIDPQSLCRTALREMCETAAAE